MPYTLNTVGTWYWGRRNCFEREGTCSSCGAHGLLRSYDTTLCFVVLYLPLLPLRRYRVIDECPRCRRHRAAKLSEWNRLRLESMNNALRAWEAAPRDNEAIITALATAVGTQNADAAGKIARGLQLLPDVSGQAWAMLASTEEYFVRLPEAEAAYQKAIAAGAGHDARDGYALLLLRTNRTDLARPLVDATLRQPGELSPLVALAAVEAYQAEGRHAEAAELMNATEAGLPALRDDKAWRALRKLSEKHQGTHKPLKRTIMRPLGQPATTRPGRTRRVPLMTVIILLLAAGGFVLSSYVKAARREVFVVSGLSTPYSVAINDQTVRLRPKSRQAITLPEGQVTIKPLGGDLALPMTELRLETSFWTRVFRSDVFVINPDRLALLVHREVRYAAGSDGADPPPPDLLVGEALYHFSSVDYVFREAPQQISLSSRSKGVTKHELTQLADVSPIAELFIVREYRELGGLLDFVFRHPLRDPVEEDYLIVAMALGGVEEIKGRIPPILDERPCRIEAHRLYQQLREATGERDAVIAEYREKLAAAPDDADLHYLLARVTRDNQESYALLEKTLSRQPDHPRALMAMSLWQWNHAGPAAAMPHVQRAVELAPTALTVVDLYLDALLANGRTDDWLDAARRYAPGVEASRSVTGRDVSAAEQEIAVLAQLGRMDEARDVRETFLAADAADQDSAPAEEQASRARRLSARLLAAEHYARGDIEKAQSALAETDEPSAMMMREILAGHLAEADLELLKQAPGDIELHLALLLAGELADSSELESAQVRLCSALRLAGDDEREVAEWLSGVSAPTEEKLRGITMGVATKGAICALLGRRFPEHRKVCYELAERYNFAPVFPQHLVKGVLAKIDRKPGMTPEEGEPQPNPPDALPWWDP